MTEPVVPTVTVIYTGGTVARLATFLDSLLAHTAWQYRLVVNGCGDEDIVLLRQRVDRFPSRLAIRSVSDDEILPHGVVLDRLLHDEREAYFSILDSDVFAVARPATTALQPHDDAVAMCSCLPMWHRASDRTMPAGFRVMGGRYLRSSDGSMLGCTYAATYRTAELRATLDRWGVSLWRYRWRELPAAVRAELSARGLVFDLYDTAKVANILLQADGYRIDHVEVPELVHVGAQSGPGATSNSRVRALVRRTGLAGVRAKLAGVSRAERASTLDLEHRRRSAVAIVDGIARGNPQFAESCDWLDADARQQLITLLTLSDTGPRS